ncbi:unnamed protein product [Periconia digitata]|uniref:Uncharacterized protein n=1 Tax=Periconia digitata TaxID=1303443 RepID=A0A9W4UQR2_9PLEO|nr:unnamed protein product [Periconia digitata]
MRIPDIKRDNPERQYNASARYLAASAPGSTHPTAPSSPQLTKMSTIEEEDSDSTSTSLRRIASTSGISSRSATPIMTSQLDTQHRTPLQSYTIPEPVTPVLHFKQPPRTRAQLGTPPRPPSLLRSQSMSSFPASKSSLDVPPPGYSFDEPVLLFKKPPHPQPRGSLFEKTSITTGPSTTRAASLQNEPLTRKLDAAFALSLYKTSKSSTSVPFDPPIKAPLPSQDFGPIGAGRPRRSSLRDASFALNESHNLTRTVRPSPNPPYEPPALLSSSDVDRTVPEPGVLHCPIHGGNCDGVGVTGLNLTEAVARGAGFTEVLPCLRRGDRVMVDWERLFVEEMEKEGREVKNRKVD